MCDVYDVGWCVREVCSVFLFQPWLQAVLMHLHIGRQCSLLLYLVLTSRPGRGHEGREHSQSLNRLGPRGKAFSAICPFPTVVPPMTRAQNEGEEGVGSLGEECSRQKDQSVHTGT